MIPALRKLFEQDNQQFGFVRFDKQERVDRPLDGQPLTDGRHYIRLRMAQMFLKKKAAFLKTWYPAVHSITQFTFVGDQPAAIPMIADASRVGMSDQGGTGDIVAKNYLLSPTTPFNGGLVTFEAGLIGIEGQNLLTPFLATLTTFSNLLAVPQLSAVMNVAGPLAKGVQDLLTASHGRMHLGYHDTFASGELKAGYIAIIRQAQNQIDPTSLFVVEDTLRKGTGLAPGENQSYQDADFMLLRVEIFEERDDWENLGSINGPWKAAITALANLDEEKAKLHLTAAKLAALQAPELTKADRRRVLLALEEEYKNFKEQIGLPALSPAAPPELAEAMANAIGVEEALALGEPTLQDILHPSPVQ